MLTYAQIGLVLIAVSCLGLLIQYIWVELAVPRDADGVMRAQPSGGMRLLWLAMLVPMMVGLFMSTESLGWHWAIRAIAGLVGGFILWSVVYFIFGIIVGLFQAPGQMKRQ